MPGSKKILTEREAILKAMATPPPGGYFVWDGVDEDDRPLTEEEMRAGMEADLQGRRGRPAGSASKVQVAIRFDREIVESFRATGKGWQTRMNAALKEWLKDHAPDQAA
jgi:uncharacterized protein (DUF4415 family)